MTVQKITPYFFFDGQAQAAISLYEKALGARPEGVLRWGEHPGMCAPGKEERVMHAALHIGSALVLLNDSPDDAPASPEQRRASVAIEVEDAEEMQRYFAALSDGGSVVEEIHDAFWGDKFGIVRDRFGITWMFTCPQKKD